MSAKPTKNPAAVSLGRRGGMAGTDAQNAARRENGKKGGRPKGSKSARLNANHLQPENSKLSHDF